MFENIGELIKDFISNEDFVEQSSLEISREGYFWKNSQRGLAILNEVAAIPILEMFNDQSQQLGKGSSRVTLIDLVNWIITKSYLVGPEQVLGNLNTYVQSRDVTVYHLMPLHNLVIIDDAIRSIQFQNGVELIKLVDVPHVRLATGASPIPGSNIGVRPDWVLIAPIVQPKHHFRDYEALKIVNSREDDLNDVQRCISLFCKFYSLQPTCHAIIPSNHSPLLSPAISWEMLSNRSSFKTRLDCGNVEIEHFVDSFILLDSNTKAKLRVAIDRLNNFNSTSSLVDRAIDLRIAMEALFKRGNPNDSITKRVSREASRFLGGSDQNRQDIRTLMRAGYEDTSTAVHTGQLGVEKQQLLERVAQLVRAAIIKKVIG